ncbi:MAG: response regulator [Kofleriaceae bacterium]
MRLRALIADDDADLLETVTDVVRDLDVDAATATTGHELLVRFAEDGPFDFVITDVAMPWMTGLQVLHAARTAGGLVPVVVMTALRDPMVARQTLSLGDQASLLLKPFSLERLVAAVRRCIERALCSRFGRPT